VGEDVKGADNALVPTTLTPALLGSSESFLGWIGKIPPFFGSAVQAGPEKIWETPFSHMANVLKVQGVPDSHLKAALLILLVLNSPRLGYPLVLEIINDEEKTGMSLLKKCLTLVPTTFYEEFDDPSKNIFVRERRELKGKVIISDDSSKYKNVASNLNSLLDRQKIPLKKTQKGEYGGNPRRIVISGPVGFISIAQNSKRTVLTFPSFLKIHLPAGEPIPDPRRIFNPKEVTDTQKSRFDLLLGYFINGFKRLQALPVRVPFSNILSAHLAKSKNTPKLNTFLDTIRIISIINNTLPESEEEYLVRTRGVEMKLARSALGTGNIQQHPLVASKVDYYILWSLMSGLIKNDNEDVFLTELQKRIFEVIKAYNLSGFATTFKKDLPMSDSEKLTTIENYSECWISQEKIFEEVNKDGREKVSNTQKIGRELRPMRDDKKIIADKNIPGEKNKPGYYVTTFDIQETVPLPEPSEIEDPVLKKEKIKIINPITGEIDEI
jgi:hypothetical protein